MQTITREKFLAYRKVQDSGRTNMYHVTAVVALARGALTQEDCFDIMKHYAIYAEEFGVPCK